MKNLLIITGPTAVGKSNIAVEVAIKYNGEIVSADSMQIYKKMDIGTGKITKSEMKGIPHYMIDIAMPDEDYSVGRYVLEARKCIDDIADRGKLPIVVGGTGLYINSLLFNHSFARAPKNENIRNNLKKRAELDGIETLYENLCEVDPVSAKQININDTKRIIRALEIYEITGKPRSSLTDDIQPVYNYSLVILDCERERLYKKINARVDKMFESGLIEEVKALYNYKNYNSMQAIGYKEVISYLDGLLTKEEVIESVKMNSRRYAKRQMTFFRGMKVIKNYIDVSNSKEISELSNYIKNLQKEQL